VGCAVNSGGGHRLRAEKASAGNRWIRCIPAFVGGNYGLGAGPEKEPERSSAAGRDTAGSRRRELVSVDAGMDRRRCAFRRIGGIAMG